MRRRILGAMLAVTTLAVVAFAIPLGVTTTNLFRGAEVAKLEQAATLLLAELSATGIDESAVIQMPALGAPMRRGVLDSSSSLLVGDGPVQADAAVLEALTGVPADARHGDSLVVAVPIFDENLVDGVIRVEEPWSVVSDASQRRWTLMAIGGIGAVLAAGALGVALARQLVAPVDDVVASAVRLGEGDFTSRVEPSGIAELDRAGDALNKTSERLETLIVRERAFASDVAHQLSTPLASLRLGLESARLDPDANSEQVIDMALQDADRLQVTIETFLAVRRDSTDQSERADLGGVCVDVTAEANRSVVGRRRVLVDLADDVPAVACPASVLTEIVRVLVDNGIQHGDGTVALKVRRRGRGVALTVSDQGRGIPAERVARIFGRRDASSAGHGIGLSLARSLAEAHELRLELTQASPHAVFTLACPGTSDS